MCSSYLAALPLRGQKEVQIRNATYMENPCMRVGRESEAKSCANGDEPDSHPKRAWLGGRGHQRPDESNTKSPELRYAPYHARSVLPPLVLLCTHAEPDRDRANGMRI